MKKLLLLLALLVPSAQLFTKPEGFVKEAWVYCDAGRLSDESQVRLYKDLANLYNQGHFTPDYIKTLLEHDYLGHSLCPGQLHHLGLHKLLERQKNRIQEQINCEKLRRAQYSGFVEDHLFDLHMGGVVTSVGLVAASQLPVAKRIFESRMTSFLFEYENSYCRTLSAQYRLVAKLLDSMVPVCFVAAAAAILINAGVRCMAEPLHKLYAYYTYLGNMEKEIKVIDAMITQLKGIQNVA